MATTNRHAHYQWCKNKTLSLSIDAQFAMVVSTICVTGVLSPNNQYNIYWSKYDRLSKYLFLSSSYPKTQLLVPEQQELPT